MLKLTTPISLLFSNENAAQQIINLSDSLECREWCMQTQLPKQELLHFDVNIIHNWNRELKQFLYRSILSKPLLELVTFHMSSCCDGPLLMNGMYQLGGIEYSREALQQHAERNIAWLRSFLSEDVAIGVENNNYYPTPAYSHITDGNFITDVVKRNGIHFLFDIAHSKITAYNKTIDYRKYISSLPLDDTIQIHISGYGINSNNIAYDAHDQTEETEYWEIRELLGVYPIKYLTVEFYKNQDGILQELERYKRLKDELNATC